jgi:hypothetical protein
MMPRLRFYYAFGLVLVVVCASCTASRAVAGDGETQGEDAKPQAAAQVAEGKVGKLPHVEFDVKQRQVRVECESLGVESPLEFFCVRSGGSEHESVLRTPAKPSDIHTALLAIGLKPGRPVQYSEALNKWLPPQGPPLHISLQWEKDGRMVSVPAHRCMRNLRTKEEMKPVNWVFCGSRVMEDGEFAADVTGYVVSVVNFDLTLIDLPELASNSNELLEWQRNADVAPPAKTKVTMLIQPAGRLADKQEVAPKGNAQRNAAAVNEGVSDVTVDQRKMDALREKWMAAVRPHSAALRDAAQAHYDVINAMRAEQQRLIDEADRLQRSIDALEKEYQDLTTPRPSTAQ